MDPTRREGTQRVTAKSELRYRIAKLYLAGQRQSQIAELVGIDRSSVSRHLKAMRKEWQAKAAKAIGKKVAIELAKIDALEAEAWECFERSKLPLKVSTASTNTTGKSASIRTEERCGDPAFLNIVAGCVDRRLKMFGLNEPDRIAIADKAPTAEPLSIEERAQRIAELFESVKARQAKPDGESG